MAHPDLDNLLNALIPRAEYFLTKYGEFYPISAVITLSGEVEHHAAFDGDEHPLSNRVIELLIEAHREQHAANRIRASGICIDSLVALSGSTQKTDALRFCLEHQSGECVEVFMPYTRGLFGKPKFGKLVAQPGTPTIFV